MTNQTEVADILTAANAQAAQRESYQRPPPDYKGVNVEFRKQKAALTRAINSKDPNKVVLACRKAVLQWSEAPFNGFWPDDHHRWQRALDDALGRRSSVELRDLA